jgi:hypothetical protein
LLRRIAVVVAALIALLGAPWAFGRALAGQDLTAMTNADRVSRGLRALSTANDLQSLAQQRADEMARSGRLAHTSNLGGKVSGWQRVGENVGRGPKLQDIETAFMNSPSHRENILDPDFTQLGVGVTFDGKEYLYVAVIFRQPTGAATSAPPPPATPPTTRAAATPKPKPPTPIAPAPTTTTTQPPTTTTTAPPPPPAPVEVAAAPPVEEPPAPVETTTTTAPRPIFANPDFLAANFSDRAVPVAATTPARGHSPLQLVVTAAGGVVIGGAGSATVLRRRPRRPRRPRI